MKTHSGPVREREDIEKFSEADPTLYVTDWNLFVRFGKKIGSVETSKRKQISGIITTVVWRSKSIRIAWLLRKNAFEENLTSTRN